MAATVTATSRESMPDSAVETLPERKVQYEVWILGKDAWELIAAFSHFEPASAMAQLRSERVRLVRVHYEEAREVERELLVEVGATRKRE